MRRHLFSLVITLAVALSVAGQAVRITPAERKLADAITAAQLKDYLYFVASDAMEGRDTPSRGLDITAEFLKLNLSRWGFKPAGDNGTFFQKMELSVDTIDAANNLLQVDGKTFNLNADFFRVRGNGSANALMVFAGHGWVVKSKSIDSYSGVNVRGRIVVLRADGLPHPTTLTSRPSNVSDADLSGTKGTDWADPVTYAAANGAAGIILIAPPQVQAQWARVARLYSGGRMFPTKLRTAATETSAALPIVFVNNSVAETIFAGASGTKDSPTPFTIDKTVSVTTMGRKDTKWTQNVVAVWEGSDPVLKQEMVAVGAHYDHVGMNQNATGDDKIWNGADDDGSGTVAVLSIAEALSKSRVRPKRSILLVWHAGEEKGLWGAEYFNKFPTVDIKKVIAQLNIDMIGRSKKPGDTNPKNVNLTGENAIYVIGSEMMSSTLAAITKGTNDAFLKMTYDYKYDDPNDTERFFFRSDHFHYAMNGIPIAFWFDGVHEDYHQPTDHADKIDYAKMEKVTRTIFLTMWELSDLRERPKVDKQLPPELTRQ
jgi:hypothetical protein